MKLIEKLKDPHWRRKNFRYWLEDPFWGGLSYAAYYFCRYLPIKTNAQLGALFGELAGKYYFSKENSKIKQNLAILRPDLTEAEQNAMVTQMWRHFGQNLSEFSVLDKLSNGRHTTVINQHYVEQAAQSSQPIILVSAHTGNWQLCANYLAEFGLNPLFLAGRESNRFIMRLVMKARGGMFSEDHLLQTGAKAMSAMCEHLGKGQGHLLWIAIDEFKKGQLQAPRLKRPINLQGSNITYAVRLAQRYNAVILPVWNKRVGLGQFSIEVGEPIRVAQDVNVEETVEKLEQLLEQWLLENIEQWLDKLGSRLTRIDLSR